MSHRQSVLIAAAELRSLIAGGPQVLDVRWNLGEPRGAGRQRYLAGHLPGARFLDLEAVLTGPTDDATLGRHPLPEVATLETGLGSLGIDPGRPIIVYDEPGSFAAGRAWWVLRWAGLDVRLLDGGITAWLAEGGSLESGEVTATPTTLRLMTGHLTTIDADAAARFPGQGTLIDARAGERFRGETEPIDARAGHIPGAVNLPVTRFWTESGTLPDELTLRSEFGGALAGPVAVYCGSGVSAAQLSLALASLGVESALYPPSWSGWSSDPARPVAVGE